MPLSTGQTIKLGSGIKTGVAPGQSQYSVGSGQSVKILGSRNVGGQLYYDIQHIGGGTGWTLASSLQKSSSSKPSSVFNFKAFSKQQSKIFANQQAKAAKQQQKQIAGAKGKTEAFVNEFTAAVPGIFESAYDKFGVTDLSNAAGALKARINDLQGNLSGVGAGGFASAGQVDRAINTKFLPRFLSANEQAQRAQQLAQPQIQTQLKAFDLRAGFLRDEIDKSWSAMGQNQKDEFNFLLEKYSTGVQMGRDELDRLQRMAEQDRQFAHDIKMKQLSGGGGGTSGGGPTLNTSGGNQKEALPASSPSNLGLSKNYSGGINPNINLGNQGFYPGFSLGSGLGTGK